MVVATRERLEDLRPLPRSLAVAGTLARQQQRAADVGEGLERGRLAPGGGRHRLVQAGEPVVDLACGHLREAQLGERAQLQVDVARLARDVDGERRQPCSRHGLAGPLRPGQGQPAVLRTRGDVGEEPLGAREPAVRGRLVVPDQRVLAREPERDPRRAGHLAVAAEARVGALPVDDRLLRLTQPPQRAAEPIERLGRLLVAERRLERPSRRLPVAAGERLVALRNARSWRGRLHRADRDMSRGGVRAPRASAQRPD